MAFEVKRYGDGTHLMTPGPPLMTPRLPNHGIPTTGVDVVDSRNRPEAQVCFPLSQNLQDHSILITSITQS